MQPHISTYTHVNNSRYQTPHANTTAVPHMHQLKLHGLEVLLSQETTLQSRVSQTSNTPTSMLVATQDRQHQVEVLTQCTRQYDRFVDPQGRPLQPGTVIFYDNFPFIVSANGRIYNYTGR